MPGQGAAGGDGRKQESTFPEVFWLGPLSHHAQAALQAHACPKFFAHRTKPSPGWLLTLGSRFLRGGLCQPLRQAALIAGVAGRAEECAARDGQVLLTQPAAFAARLCHCQMTFVASPDAVLLEWVGGSICSSGSCSSVHFVSGFVCQQSSKLPQLQCAGVRNQPSGVSDP